MPAATTDRRQFERFVVRYKSVVCAVAYSATGDRALAEEIAQETFLVAWRKLPTLETPPAMPAWLCGIARRTAWNARRRRGRERPSDAAAQAAATEASPLDALLARERELLVASALARVPVTYREPLVLFYLGGKSVRVVADALELSPAAVRQRLSRGRRCLREQVDLVERELPRARPTAAFVAAVVAALELSTRTAGAAPAAVGVGSRAAAALLPAAAVCGALATWSAREPAPAAAPLPALVEPADAGELDVPTPAAVAFAAEPRARAAPSPAARPARTPAPTRARSAAPAAPATPAVARAPSRSRTLERALAFYRRGDYESASLELHKVVSEQTEDSAADRQLAELFLGKSLYHLGFRIGALARFEAIVRAGPSHRHRRDVLVWLGALARELPDPSAVAPLLAQYPEDALDDAKLDGVRDELAYLLGRHRATEPDPEPALALLDSVREGSAPYLRARFAAAVLHVRHGRARPAGRALAEILAIARDQKRRGDYDRAELRRLAERARLNLARLQYSVGDYDKAIEQFERVPRRSELWPTALVEASWAYFLAGRPARGLGHLHTLHAPQLDGAPFPEAAVIEATVYFDRCHFRRAERTVKRFERRYDPIIEKLEALAKRRADDEAAFTRIARGMLGDARRSPSHRSHAIENAGREQPDAGADARRLARQAWSDRALQRRFAMIEQVDAELARHEATDGAWRATAVGVDVLQELTVQRSLLEADAGRLARARIARLVEDLVRLRGDMRRIRIEMLGIKAAAGTMTWPKQRPLAIYAIDDQGSYWPWQGEYWRDELGRYVIEVESLCR